MCSTQADNSSRKLWLLCGCQFPWCALALTGLSLKRMRAHTHKHDLIYLTQMNSPKEPLKCVFLALQWSTCSGGGDETRIHTESYENPNGRDLGGDGMIATGSNLRCKFEPRLGRFSGDFERKLYWCQGACGIVVGWGTMVQAGRTRVRTPMRSLDF
jgi:hypothetical protein